MIHDKEWKAVTRQGFKWNSCELHSSKEGHLHTKQHQIFWFLCGYKCIFIFGIVKFGFLPFDSKNSFLISGPEQSC